MLCCSRPPTAVLNWLDDVTWQTKDLAVHSVAFMVSQMIGASGHAVAANGPLTSMRQLSNWAHAADPATTRFADRSEHV
jgi:hypothetical protein